MYTFTAIFDACVLYPVPLRDLLMYLTGSDLFQARWTDEIHDEWMRNLLKNCPEDRCVPPGTSNGNLTE